MIESKTHKDNQILPKSERRNAKKWPKVVAGFALLGASVAGTNKGIDTAPRPNLGEVIETSLAPNEALTIEDVTNMTKQSIKELEAGEVGVFIPIRYTKHAVFRDKLDNTKSFGISRPITMPKQSGITTSDPNESYYGAIVATPDNQTEVVFFDPSNYDFSLEDVQNGGPDLNYQKPVLRIENNLLNGLFIDESTGSDGRLPLARFSN